MAPILYYANGSPPCNQVLLTIKLLNLDVDLRVLHMHSKDHLKPEFLKLNPQHTVPTLVDGNFTMWESRAISRYLINKYGAGSKLYPQDPQARAVVDQRLDFDIDIGTLVKSSEDYLYSLFYEPNKKPDEAKLKKVQVALGLLNTFLEATKYAAGDDLTLADVAFVATISVMEASEIDLTPYTNIARWYNLIKTTPGYQDKIQKNVEAYKAMMAIYRAK